MKRLSLVMLLLAFSAPVMAQQNNINPAQQNPYQKPYKVIKVPRNSTVLLKPINCNPRQQLLGKSIDDINGMRFNQPVRIVRPGDPMTMDYNEMRLNILLDERGIIRVLRCG